MRLSVAPLEGQPLTAKRHAASLREALGPGWQVTRHYHGRLVVSHRETEAAITVLIEDEGADYDFIAEQARSALAEKIAEARSRRGALLARARRRR